MGDLDHRSVDACIWGNPAVVGKCYLLRPLTKLVVEQLHAVEDVLPERGRATLGIAHAPRLVDDFSLHPRSVGLAGDRLDDEAKQTITMVRIFEARVRVDGRRLLQFTQEFPTTVEWSSALELAGVQAIGDDPGAMGQEFADRRFRDLRMHLGHILTDWIVKAKLSLFAKLHKSRRDEAFGVRCDAKSMAGGELFFADDISIADGSLEYDLVSMRDGKDTAGLLRGARLKLNPSGNVVEVRLEQRSIRQSS
jgi:hypothetical protein